MRSVRFADLFRCQPLGDRSGHILYLDFLARMLPTLRKIDETESTPMNTYYIPGFRVPMQYLNAMKILHQFIYLRSVEGVGNEHYQVWGRLSRREGGGFSGQ